MIWNIDPVLVRIGQFEVRYYGVFFVLALLGGYHLWVRQMIRGGHGEETAERLVLPAALAVVVGARLGHVIFYEPGQFLADPVSILYVWQGGLASHGATVGLMATLYWFSRTAKIGLLEVCDRFSFSAAWGAAMVRLGNFMNSEIVGRPTSLSWGVKFPRFDSGVPIEAVPFRHPSQIYEFLLGAAVLFGLLLVDRALGGERRPKGVVACSFLAMYFTGRFIVEFFKAQQGLPESWPVTMGQLLSVPFAVAGFAGLVILSRSKSGRNRAKGRPGRAPH